MTSVDWRANRLADAAAKAAASANRSPAALRIKLQRTVAAYEHALAELAVVTSAANHHPVQVISEDGAVVRRYVRDSAPIPRRRSARVYKAIPLSADEIVFDCVNPNHETATYAT